MANTIEPSLCASGGDAAFLSNYFDHLLLLHRWKSTVKGKGMEEYLYSAFLAKVVHSKRSGMDHTVLPANNTVAAFPS